MESAFLYGIVLVALSGQAAQAPAAKPFQKRLKVAAILPATSTISVREPDLEIVWNKETRFLVHRSVRLKDVRRGTPLHILGRLHSARSPSLRQTDSVLADVGFLGMGKAFEPPPLTPRGPFVRWHSGLLDSAFDIKIGENVHRLTVGDDAAVYSLEPTTPAALQGKSIIVRGKVEPATAEDDAKRRRVTRVVASEIHWVELNAEHTKVFQLQWGETRKSPQGLRAEYFDTPKFTSLKVSRIDPNVNFDWGTGTPDPSMDGDTFSVRWTGQITVPATGSYTFQVVTDDGVRLWVDNQLLVDEWQRPTDASATLSLVAGKRYDIRMEYFDGLKNAFAKLYWSSPTMPKEIIPHTNLYPAPAASSDGAATQAKATTPTRANRAR
jgi:hypothetical protein